MEELNEGVEVPVEEEVEEKVEQEETVTDDDVTQDYGTEEQCECYSVAPPKRPWKTTFTFGTYDCTLCGRRLKK